MRIYLTILAVLALPHTAQACESRLVGKWKSDAEATLAYNRAHARLEARQDQFLESLLGKLTIEFNGKSVHTHLPDTKVKVNGEMKDFAGSDDRKNYKTLFCNERVSVVEAPQPFSGEIGVTTYVFIDSDRMWVYAGTNEPGVPDLHIREYFNRVR